MGRFRTTIQRVLCMVLLLLFIALLVSRDSLRADEDTSVSLPERVARLEEFRKQQRDWNTWMDTHVSTHADDLYRSQGEQDARINIRLAAMEEKLNTIYTRQMVVLAFGNVGALIFAVGTPIAWSSYSKRHRKVMLYQHKLERICRAMGYEMPFEEAEEPRAEDG